MMDLMLVLFSIAAGLVTAIFVTMLLYFLRNILILPLVRDAMIKRAAERGHAVEAKMMLPTSLYDPIDRKSGVFTYKYNGVRYKYVSWDSHKLPDEIMLYFQENPRKACRYNEFGTKEAPYFLMCYWAVVVVMIATIYILIQSLF